MLSLAMHLLETYWGWGVQLVVFHTISSQEEQEGMQEDMGNRSPHIIITTPTLPNA